ncbi:MAG: cell division protein SepF [Corynebacterium sp.]|uniref:cell division protein SepF n=1 Tax=Corynebacterium sp. TaxID=1720 RepID=UPI0026DB1924|nr:cell division protein SepF [Corynebacterium sp.]MDO4761431.1 cell division protein SepF [Corynebacterium sp.]
MSLVNKTKRFFGLDSEAYAYDHDDAYYDDVPRYEGTAAYAPERSYEPAPGYSEYREERPVHHEASIVTVKIFQNNDAVKIGEPFRDGDAVVFDLSALPAEGAKGIIDFAAGLCYALRGHMVKLDGRIFAITPENSALEIEQLKHAANLY